MKKLLVIGAGGHARSVIDSALDSKEFDEIGVVSSNELEWNDYRDVSWIGTDEDAKRLFDEGFHYAALGIGYIGNGSTLREHLFQQYKEIGFTFSPIIDPSATVSKGSDTEEGVFIAKGAVINANAHIGYCSIINSASLVEHDCVVGDFTHVAVRAVLCGAVHVGRHVLVGANSTVLQELNVGDDAVIGAGTLVLTDVTPGKRALGLYKGSGK